MGSFVALSKYSVMKKAIALILFFIVFLSHTQAQKKVHHDTTFKNTVRINITPVLVTGQIGNLALGYERVVKRRQTFSVNVGYLQLPVLITTGSGNPVQWLGDLNNSGFLASADYRFYFSRNKYAEPDGLYWGPYITNYYFDKKARAELFKNDVAEASADVQTYLNMTMAGLQLGYQFVIWNRWTIDLILFGPGVGFYDLSMRINAGASVSGDEEYLQGVYDALVSLFPAMEQLFDEQEIKESGATRFNGLGYRFVFQIGFRF
jgi:hypothetical protein